MPDDPQNPSLEELDALLASPDRWPSLDPDLLRHLWFYRCLSYGINPEDEAVPGLLDLTRAAVARLGPEARRQTAVQVARAVERLHREHEIREGAGCTNGLLPFLLEDPDASVVATTAYELATLLPNEEDDPLSGPHYVRSLLEDVSGEEARAGIVAGLLYLGDERVRPLVAGTWARLGAEARTSLALLIQDARSLDTLVVDFLLSWLEDEAREPDGPTFGVVAATTARAGLKAREHGVVQIRCAFPVTDAAEASPFEVVQEWTLEAFVPQVAARLERLPSGAAAAEMIDSVRRCWGLADRSER